MGAAARFRRRGASYVFFLGASMLVMVIGLSALTVVRVKRQGAEAVNDHIAARMYAQSAVEQGLLAIYSNASWRDAYAHYTWSAMQPIGAGTFAWKLVDEVNNSLTLDRNAPLRVHGKGVRSDSTWIYSVEVQPPPESVPSSLLVNGNFEKGTTGWTWFQCDIASDAIGPHGGLASLWAGNPNSQGAGPSQSVMASIESGKTYSVELWIWLKDLPDGVTVTLSVAGTGNSSYPISANAVAGSWTKVSGQVTPTWTGSLTSADLAVATTTTLQEFKIDDVSMKGVPGPVGIVPGTWRREAQPLIEIIPLIQVF